MGRPRDSKQSESTDTAFAPTAADRLGEDHTAILRNAERLNNILGRIQACGLYSHWMAPFLEVDDNCILAYLMRV